MDAVSVTAAAGFAAAGVAAGIKPAGLPDVAVVTSVPGTVAAAVFTVHRAPAAPVVLSRSHLAAGPSTRAVVLNSGCANAATGDQGDAIAALMAHTVASDLGCAPEEVLVCSTGSIGSTIDEGVISAGMRSALVGLGTTPDAGTAAATAIMTTDTQPKESVVEADGFVVGGMAKGAGMIRPDMATMIAVITTDAVVDPGVLDAALRKAVDDSFHGLNVDGCASTNDTVILLASGATGVVADAEDLTSRLTTVCADLAQQIATDAEGASRVVTLEVEGTADAVTARRLGRTVADSALVRAAFFGGDPNWGRIVAALGTSPEPYDPTAVAIWFDGTQVASDGCGVAHDDDALASSLATGDFTVRIRVGDGPGVARVLTTDLTPDYAIFNGERS